MRSLTLLPGFLPVATLEGMINELIRLDGFIEPYGLVDYDQGVWEEEIVDVFLECIDLLVVADTVMQPV